MRKIVGITSFVLILIGLMIGHSLMAKDKKYTAYKDGIAVEVLKINRGNGKTVIEFFMNNHRYDLSGMKVKEYSSLGGTKPEYYVIRSSRMGGHHVEAEIIFDKELSGQLVIGLDKDLTFEFTI